MSTRTKSSQRAPKILWVLVLLGLIGVVLQLIYVQIIEGPTYAQQGLEVRTRQTDLMPMRGEIVDANGTTLATSVETHHIAVNQVNIRNAKIYKEDGNGDWKLLGIGPVYAAQVLAPILDLDEAELGGQLIGNSTYHYLKKDVSVETWRKVRALHIYGIETEPSFQRQYPNGSVAASVIGSIDAEGKGSSGLELTQDEVLLGKPGKRVLEVGPGGQVIPGGRSYTEPAVNGGVVHTTLRLDLQHAVEEIVNKAVKTYSADWGGAVVQEISTGKLLAMADSGNKKITSQPQTSRLIQYAVEPGSVGKIVTMATALEKGAITPLTPISTPYEYTTPDGQRFIDSHEHPTYTLTTTGVLAESSNTGTIQIGMKVSDQDRYDTMKRFGFGELTDIGMPGETPGILVKPEKWDPRQRYTTMFGQGYAVTQLQQVNMMSAIANGGVMQPSRLIDGWTLRNGEYEAAPQREPHRVMDADTADTLKTMLESTVQDESGTAHYFAVEGYRVAAKTGTAELFENGASAGTSTTVVGVVPAENPTLAISVILYRPRAGLLSSDSAGPLFHDVVTESVRNLGIPPSAEKPVLYPMHP